jgi:hypothetical protein
VSFVLNKLDGLRSLVFEQLFYHFADTVLLDQALGRWEFFELDNGGFYWMQADPRPLRVVSLSGHVDTMMNGEAAGILVTLLTLRHYSASSGSDNAIRCASALEVYARTLEEWSYIERCL